MIEKEIERQIAYLHAAYGLVAGILFGIFFDRAVIPFVSVLIWGVMVSYPVMLVTKKMFKLSDEDYNIKSWLTKGFLYFFMMWLVAWVFVYNI